MILKDFVNLVAKSHNMMAIRRQSGKGFAHKTSNIWVDDICGFSWCTREEFPYGEDWKLSKCEVLAIEIIKKYGTDILCAVID